MIYRLISRIRQFFSKDCGPIHKIGNSPIVLSLVNRPNLYFGISPEALKLAVIDLQTKLSEQGFSVEQTGQFDEKTEQVLKEYQCQRGLVVDGKVGPLTWAALLYADLHLGIERTPKVLEDIKFLKSNLNQRGLIAEVNDVFDREMVKAIKAFQLSQNLVPDGKCGPRTWSVLLGQQLDTESNSQVIQIRVMQCLDWVLAEQVIIVASILIGMYFSPSNHGSEFPFMRSLILSYALTWFGPLCMEKIFEQFPITKKFPLFRFAPYVVIGLLWNKFLPYSSQDVSLSKRHLFLPYRKFF